MARKRVPATTAEYVEGQAETTFQASIVEMARALGWLVFHDNDSRGNESGFPDLVMVREGWMVIAELKRDVGRLSAAQSRWLSELEQVKHLEVRVLRPRDWPEIEEVLRGGS